MNFVTKKMIWQETYQIRNYELHSKGHMSIQAICNYLQEAASCHAEHLEMSYHDLIAQNLIWVLSRLHVQMKSYPKWKERVQLETWPSGVDKIYAFRDFCLKNENHEVFGLATTAWAILKLDNRRPIRLLKTFDGFPFPERARAIDDHFKKLPKLQTPQFEKQFRVRLSDVDINHHVNNVSYIGWIIETIPQQIWENCQLNNLEIGFRAESQYGDQIISQSQMIDDKIFIHRLLRERDQVELAQAKTIWKV